MLIKYLITKIECSWERLSTLQTEVALVARHQRRTPFDCALLRRLWELLPIVVENLLAHPRATRVAYPIILSSQGSVVRFGILVLGCA